MLIPRPKNQHSPCTAPHPAPFPMPRDPSCHHSCGDTCDRPELARSARVWCLQGAVVGSSGRQRWHRTAHGGRGRGTAARQRDRTMPRAARQAPSRGHGGWAGLVFTPPKKRPSSRKQNPLCANTAARQVCFYTGSFEPEGRGGCRLEVSFSVQGSIWELSRFPDWEAGFSHRC